MCSCWTARAQPLHLHPYFISNTWPVTNEGQADLVICLAGDLNSGTLSCELRVTIIRLQDIIILQLPYMMAYRIHLFLQSFG